ncbi:MAG: hypothetical protein IJU98_01370 [Synergistaceae bacterium]|nr:hypothetical protein [Synergistaceae bacterium]
MGIIRKRFFALFALTFVLCAAGGAWASNPLDVTFTNLKDITVDSAKVDKDKKTTEVMTVAPATSGLAVTVTSKDKDGKTVSLDKGQYTVTWAAGSDSKTSISLATDGKITLPKGLDLSKDVTASIQTTATVKGKDAYSALSGDCSGAITVKVKAAALALTPKTEEVSVAVGSSKSKKFTLAPAGIKGEVEVDVDEDIARARASYSQSTGKVTVTIRGVWIGEDTAVVTFTPDKTAGWGTSSVKATIDIEVTPAEEETSPSGTPTGTPTTGTPVTGTPVTGTPTPSGTPDMTPTNPEDKTEEEIDAEREAESGAVEDTRIPAGTDLLDNSDTASEALKKANDALSVSPKVVKPEPLSESEMTQVLEKLKSLSGTEADIPSDFKPEDVKPATAENLSIGELPTSLSAQAQIIERLFALIGNLLTKMTAGGAENGVVIATSLPTLTPKADGYFPMKVNLRNLTSGRRVRFWPSVAAFEAAANGSSVSLAVEEGSAFFLDKDGNPTTTVADNASEMTVVPYLRAGTTYSSAFITADATESDRVALETLAAETNKTKGSGGGGCDALWGAGLGTLALAAVLPAFLRKSR